MSYEMNQNYLQAAAQVPYSQQYGQQQATQAAPISFQGGAQQQYAYAPQQEESGGLLSFRNLIIGAGLVTAGLATHKTYGLNKAFKAAQEKGVIAKEAEFQKGSTFLQNLNPLNWFGHDDAAKKLTDAGYKSLEGVEEAKGKILCNEAGDIVILNGKKALTPKFEAHEDAAKILEKAAEAPKAEAPADAPKAEAPKADAPKAEAPKADAPKAPETTAPAPSPKTNGITENQQKILTEKNILGNKLNQLDTKLQTATEAEKPNIEAEITQCRKQLAELKAKPEYKDAKEAVLEIRKERKTVNNTTVPSLKEKLTAQRSQLSQKTLTDSDKIQENIDKTLIEIQQNVFGGGEIKKSTGFRANVKNQKKAAILSKILKDSETKYAEIANKKSPEALALQDKMATITEVIKNII